MGYAKPKLTELEAIATLEAIDAAVSTAPSKVRVSLLSARRKIVSELSNATTKRFFTFRYDH